MKVAVPAEGPNFNARVSDRLGLSPYLFIVNLESKEFEILRSPRDSGGSGTGMQMVALIIAKKSNVILTDWCSSIAEKHLSAHGVDIVTGMSGTVAEVLENFENTLKIQEEKVEELAPLARKIDRRVVAQAVLSASSRLKNLLPVMMGVVFLVGLFSAFISEEFLASLFSGRIWWDSFWGVSIGSVFAGNPINSYVIGGKLLELGVGLVAVTAFICSWVTVGLIQLPAESAAMGWKFAFVRNLSCFVLSMAISFLMMLIMNLFGR